MGQVLEVDSFGFNPRTREGCDCATDTNSPVLVGFNPRTREGCDLLTEYNALTGLVSIHAPVKGATFIMDVYT